MKKHLSDDEVDAITFVFPTTPVRMNYRRRWGHGAGVRAYGKGTHRSENPFDPSPLMPMHNSWLDGWDEAETVEKRRTGEEPNA